MDREWDAVVLAIRGRLREAYVAFGDEESADSDLVRLDNYGELSDGRFVVIDYGHSPAGAHALDWLWKRSAGGCVDLGGEGIFEGGWYQDVEVHHAAIPFFYIGVPDCYAHICCIF